MGWLHRDNWGDEVLKMVSKGENNDFKSQKLNSEIKLTRNCKHKNRLLGQFELNFPIKIQSMSVHNMNFCLEDVIETFPEVLA